MSKLSVIIPTLNAGLELRRSLPPLAVFEGLDMLRELILVDGGSNDDTLAIGDAAGAEIVTAERGRGRQLAAGGAAARGEWLLFLHADTVLDARWREAVAAFITAPSNQTRAGYFRFALDDSSVAARVLEKFVATRCWLFGLPYGDQGLLIRRDLYRDLGGFSAMPFLEDVALVRRIGRKRMTLLTATATTSAARYRKDGYLLRSLRNITCLTLYFLGAPPRLLLKIYT
jgi:rSAM/selenodomain-associated transferase 2